MYSTVAGWIGWAYIPRFVAQHLLRFTYQLRTTYLGRKPPPPGSLAHQQHYRLVYAFVVLAYLLYNLVESSRTLPPNFYQTLGVLPDVDDNGLKVAFRQFAKKNHPDRPGVGREGEALFIMVRDVFEALKDPVMRFAYDRFGPDVLTWPHMSTPREYLLQGLMRSSAYHIVGGLALAIFSAMGKQSPVKFWRYVLFVTLFIVELGMLLYPSPATNQPFLAYGANKTILHVLFPQRVAFQHILFLHQLFIFLTAALSNIAPYFFPTSGKSDSESVLEGFNNVTESLNREAANILRTEFQSIHPTDPSVPLIISRTQPLPSISQQIDVLSHEMENMVIERNLMQESGPLRSIWEAAISRRRAFSTTAATAGGDGLGLRPNGNISGLPSPVSDEERRSTVRPPYVRASSSYVRARSVSY